MKLFLSHENSSLFNSKVKKNIFIGFYGFQILSMRRTKLAQKNPGAGIAAFQLLRRRLKSNGA
jgi:hypothetical protein